MTEEDVRAFAIPRIARYKVPKRVFFVDDFPMTPSMKVQKFKLREMAEELVREMCIRDSPQGRAVSSLDHPLMQ